MSRLTQTIALLLLWAATVLLCARPVTSNQLWHDVNRYDAHGNECKLREKKDIVCSRLCVTDTSNCPSSLQPSCPDGQTFCADGQCHSQCTDKIQANNPCHCKRSGRKLPDEAVDLVPCMTIPNVTIYGFRPWESKFDIRSACGSQAEIADQSKTVGVWGSSWIGDGIDSVWAECPAAPPPNYKYNESYWLATFSVNGALALFTLMWSVYKYWAERSIRSATKMANSPDARETEGASMLGAEDPDDGIAKPAINKPHSGGNESKDDLATEKRPASSTKTAGDQASSLGQGITLFGYNNNIFGTLCVWYIAVVTILWICYMGVWTADYYGSLPGSRHGVAYSLSYESDFLQLATFLLVWGITFIILITLYIVKPHFRNYFRIRTLPCKGQFVCIIRPVHSIKLVEEKISWIQQRINQLTERLIAALSRDRDYTTCRVDVTSGNLTYFTYQCTRYIYDSSTGQFAPFEFDLGTNHRSLVQQARGLSSEEAFSRQELVGPNFIEVKVPNIFKAFAREFFGFFYIYQFIFLWAFYFYAYYQVGLVDTGIILLSATIKVALRMQSERRLKRMAEQEEEVMVLRDGKWATMTTRHLVTGDVIEIASGAHMSCDCILLSGTAIMNESSLTGEPLPIRKFPLHIDDGHYDHLGSGKISTLFAGTIVSQVQPVAKSADSLESDRVLALVWHTGTMSEKGQLVRKILFPNPITFVFNEQMRIVIFILVLYAGFVMGMAGYLYQGNSTAIVFFGVFSLSQLCSPILPAAMVIGQSVAAVRLRKKQVYCVDPQRIMIAGKVQMFCFDKTGTLTREGLEFYGGQCVDPSAGAFEPLESRLPETSTLFQQAVASCHAVTELNGQLIGNPVDIEQFRASKATMDPAPEYLDAVIPSEECTFGKLHVVRRFEFVHARASMSVTVLDEATGTLHVFVKGSFERIKGLSRAQSVPGSYDESCARLAREGCYVLAFAHKTIDIADPAHIKDLTQDELESGCDLLGLIVFKNMLKDDTERAIAELKHGSTRTVMITGDTALTGIYIARQCGMIPTGSRVLLGECKTHDDEIQWMDVDTMEPVKGAVGAHLAELGSDGFPTTELAVNGAAF
ncbi:hypothetical protein GGH99_005407, partial [Coemansia sp. RSA 1285]